MGQKMQWSAALYGIVVVFFASVTDTAGRDGGDATSYEACPGQCACLGNAVDCSKRKLRNIPGDIPSWTEVLDVSWNGISQLDEDAAVWSLDKLIEIDLSHNQLSLAGEGVFRSVENLQVLKLSHNNLARIPRISAARSSSSAGSNLTHLILSHNSIGNLDTSSLDQVTSSLRVLDLGFNVIADVRNGSFPFSGLRHLLLNDNGIELIDRGAFDNMTSLEVLRLNKNKLQSLLPAVFSRLDKLRHLELSGNRLRRIEGLRFQGLSSLTALRLRRNSLVELMDGGFYGLSALETLQLDHNNLTRVHGGFLFGLDTLERLSLSHNKITSVEVDSWSACKRLRELDLSHNRLTAVTDITLAKLSSLVVLRLSHNRLSYITENAFKDMGALKILELDSNELSGILDDSVAGVFSPLVALTQLSLSSNKIKSIAKRAFDGLGSLHQISLLLNNVTSIQENAFSPFKNLQELRLNTSSLLCDCHLSWLPAWLRITRLHQAVNVRCGHPVAVREHSVLELSTDQFLCDDFVKPVITVQPVSQIALKDGNLNLTCVAVTSSDTPMTISWKRDHSVLSRNLCETSERRQTASEGGLVEQTSTLRLWPVKADHAGAYQCVASNEFGTAYSVRATVTISVFPRLVKAPTDSTVRAGRTARLECAAVGQPTPEVAWQKDGGDDFPAARERRMHVMPSDDVFFIVQVKPDDQGIYTCTAKNDAGSVRVNATVTVIQAPSFAKTTREKVVREGDTVVLECMSQSGGSARTRVDWLKDGQQVPTDSARHHYAADSQMLIITQVEFRDAAIYTCVVSNSLGSERAVSKLTVVSASVGRLDEGFVDGGADRHDMMMRIGLAVIAGVGGIVLTSFVWVLVIYCLRRTRGSGGDSSSASSSTTSDTIVVGAGTSSDLSYGTMKLKGSTCSGGYNFSPMSSWIYDRNGHMSSCVGGSMKRMAPSPGVGSSSQSGCRCQDSGCYCDDLMVQQHVYQREMSHGSSGAVSMASQQHAWTRGEIHPQVSEGCDTYERPRPPLRRHVDQSLHRDVTDDVVIDCASLRTDCAAAFADDVTDDVTLDATCENEAVDESTCLNSASNSVAASDPSSSEEEQGFLCMTPIQNDDTVTLSAPV